MVSRAHRQTKRFAFVMDPLEHLDLAWDTSLCLARELNGLGHETVLVPSSSVSFLSNQVLGRGYRLLPLGDRRYLKGPEETRTLKDFNAVLIRKDPPFDASYLALTYLLEPICKETFVMNHPRGIRNANEKLWGLRFPRWSPPTLVSSDPEQILDFQKKIRLDLVVKPLYEKGGKGVFLLKRTGRGSVALLQKATQKGNVRVVVQKFIPVPKGKGDKRILIWRGEILGAFERIPKGGEFRSNLSLGGNFTRCVVTKSEKELVRELRPPLLKEGLVLVGIDVRAGYLLEVNVTSPAGLVELDQLYGNVTRQVATDICRITSS